ncbi:hypothetical protein DM02DRAFT_221273 [Periconia macrospinosa]|uniref:DUF7730 domain-containing protein n=1 Tax=Periconia macrospinosa TaxID=97972 RepID=A0A2V1D638_9PLEO|nr:hypothetical protein DM02DRAFT_221273 [Periconia macrospinosa]
MERERSESTQAPAPPVLLRLPGELRNQIYGNLLGIYMIWIEVEQDSDRSPYRPVNYSLINNPPNPWYYYRALPAENASTINALLRTSRQTYSELHPLLYSRCISFFSIHNSFPELMSGIDSCLLASIRILQISQWTFESFKCRSKTCAIKEQHSHMGDPEVLPSLEKIIYTFPWKILAAWDSPDPFLENRDALVAKIDTMFNNPRTELLFLNYNMVKARRKPGEVLEIFKPTRDLRDLL